MNKKFILIFMCLLCFGFILFNSLQNSSLSHARSMNVVENITNVMSNTELGKNMLTKFNVGQIDHVVRKAAHVSEFFLLGLIISFTLNRFKIDDKNFILYTLFTILLIADIDEFVQLFIVNRTSKVSDVFIDFGGGMAAVALFMIFSCPRGKHYKK